MNGPGTIVVTGVECTGKTTLARSLAERLGREYVPEVARDWLAERDGRYDESDLATLATLQQRAEAQSLARGRGAVADTDLTVLRVWSEVRFGRCDARILAALRTRSPAVYLLPDVDLPWEADPLRDAPDPDERARLHERYVTLLEALPHDWVRIGGAGPARLDAALAALARLGVSV